jgi:hypothetical protein
MTDHPGSVVALVTRRASTGFGVVQIAASAAMPAARRPTSRVEPDWQRKRNDGSTLASGVRALLCKVRQLAARRAALSSAYSFLAGTWPFGVIEAVWCAIALRRFVVAPTRD